MIFLSLGSNMGDKIPNLQQALAKLALHGVQILRVSSFYETAPWGNIQQDDFVNIVTEVAFDYSPQKLLEIALTVEEEMGRVRKEKWGPRIIDIDIIIFHNEKIDTENLQIPHPYYKEREFVMVPLRELEPNWVRFTS